jgi:hypothetical protein
MTDQKMTIQEAIKQGYTRATCEGSDYATDLDDLLGDPSIVEEGDTWWIVEKDSFSYQIHENLIQGLIESHLEDQDEVYDEDGQLIDQLSTVDFSEITSKVNEALSPVQFFKATSISLVFDVPTT